MGVGVVDAPAPEPSAAAAVPEQVVGVVHLVAALAEHAAAVLLADGLGSGLHPGGVGNGHPRQNFCLRDVGRHHLGQRQQLTRQSLHGVIPQQAGAGGGHHHRVHHDVPGTVGPQLLRDDVDERGRGHHADLHRVGEDIGEHGVQLLSQKLRRRLKDAGDAGGVLGRQSGDGAHGKNAVGGHGLDVGLDASAAAGIAAGNGQCGFHGIYPSVLESFVVALL